MTISMLFSSLAIVMLIVTAVILSFIGLFVLISMLLTTLELYYSAVESFNNKKKEVKAKLNKKVLLKEEKENVKKAL